MNNYSKAAMNNYSHKLSSQVNTSKIYSKQLIQKLLGLWRSKNVEQFYQDCYLEYLDYLPQSCVEDQISNEIKLTHQNKSMYFPISKGLFLRKKYLHKLQQKIEFTEGKKEKTEKDIDQICALLSQLRMANLITAESLIQMNNHFSEQIQSTARSLSGYNSFFEMLNQDIEFIKVSFMRKFIIFSSSYDPFFLHHYERLKKHYDEERLRSFKSIEDLFNIPISLAYKLLKAQQIILEFLSGNVNRHRNKSPLSKTKKFNFKINQDEDMNSQPSFNNQNFQKLNLIPSQLTNNAYFNRRPTQIINTPNTQKEKYNFKTYDNQLERSRTDDPKLAVFFQNKNPSNSIVQNTQRKGSLQLPRINEKKQLMKIKKYDDSQKSNGNNPKMQRYKTEPSQQSDHLHRSQPKYLTSLNQSKIIEPESIRKHSLNDPYENIRKIQKREEEFYSSIPKNSYSNNLERLTLSNKPPKEKIFSPTKKIQKFQSQSQSPSTQLKSIAIQHETYEPQFQQNTEKIGFDSSKKPLKISPEKQKINKVIFEKEQKQDQNNNQAENNEKIWLKTFKLKAGTLGIQEIFIFLSELNIKEKYRSIFEIRNWDNSIKSNQYYLHKFYLNDNLSAVSLCCALPQGDTVIKYWGPMKNVCTDKLSEFLFQKYLEHIQKNSIGKSIFYNALQIKEIIKCNFIKEKERIYKRERKLPIQVDNFNYYPFLSVNFCILAVDKKFSSEKILISSKDIKQFDQNKFICFNYLLIINKLLSPGSFKAIATYTPKIQGSTVHEKLLSQKFIENPYQRVFSFKQANLLTMKIYSPIRSAFFISHKGFIKTTGYEIYSTEDEIICCLQLLKYNAKIYFANGFKKLSDFIERLKTNIKNTTQRVQFSVKMFSKKIRGRVHSINLKDEFCYGNFEFNFIWRDYLKGKIQHSINECEIFGDEPFYVLLEVEKEMMFAFEVDYRDYVE